MSTMKAIGLSILGLTVLIGLGWLLTGNNLAMTKVFAPKFEAVRRETFEQSKAYQDGVIQELRAYQFEYLKADDAHKAAMGPIIRHKLSGFPSDQLPYDLQQFVSTLP